MATIDLLCLQLPAGTLDQFGNTYPAAIAVPTDQHQDIADKAGNITWALYGSAAALTGGSQPWGEHNTLVNTPGFLQGAAETVAALIAAVNLPGLTLDTLTEAQNTALICISFGLSVEDTPTNPPSVDTNGNPALVPFFAGATVVSVTVTV